jgi:hypothetical protein
MGLLRHEAASIVAHKAVRGQKGACVARYGLLVVLAIGTLSGCSTATKQVNPVAAGEVKRICIIENPRVSFDFLGVYRKTLEGRGVQVEVLPSFAGVSACPVTSRYTANYRWDLVMYLSYAEITVYREGQPAGRAMFSAGTDRFFATDTKIKELIDELFKG